MTKRNREKNVKPENDIYVRVFCTRLFLWCVFFFSSSLYDERHRIIAHSLTVDVMCAYVIFFFVFFLIICFVLLKRP